MDQIVEHISRLDTKFKLQLLSEKLIILLLKEDFCIDRREIASIVEKEKLKIKVSSLLKYYNLCLNRLKDEFSTINSLSYEDIGNKWVRLKEQYRGIDRNNLIEIFLRKNISNQSLRFKHQSINSINDCIEGIFVTTKSKLGTTTIIERTDGIESYKTCLPLNKGDKILEDTDTKTTIVSSNGVTVSIQTTNEDCSIDTTKQINQEQPITDCIEFKGLSKPEKCNLIKECIVEGSLKTKDVVDSLLKKNYTVKYDQVYDLFNLVKKIEKL